jgi:hypothetical protein
MNLHGDDAEGTIESPHVAPSANWREGAETASIVGSEHASMSPYSLLHPPRWHAVRKGPETLQGQGAFPGKGEEKRGQPGGSVFVEQPASSSNLLRRAASRLSAHLR